MEPGKIKKLDEAVVNRIAAGEIIQRPANALKELIENSLDAKASFIQVTVKSGGMKLLQIQDNGTGIRKEDLPIVCERFTTSKLTNFEDLAGIGTFGFRGEALASISYVAHLTILTKTSTEKCGYKASYDSGNLKADPKPCAANQGTIITIEDLFHNMPQRRQALKSPNEEFQKITDVVAKYAVHNANVGFSLKCHGDNPTLRTVNGSTPEENIATIYGANIGKQLMKIELTDELYKFNMYGWVTNVNYSSKRNQMLLFINHRLVESAALKNALDSVYNCYLAKGTHPFAYISLNIEPTNIDVNVHPTKHEVHFIHEEEIIEKIKNCLEKKLLGSNSTRTLYKQLKMPGAKETNESTPSSQDTRTNVERIYAKDMIRTDAKEQKLDKFLLMQGENESFSQKVSSTDESIRNNSAKKSKEIRLTSILNMQKEVEKCCSIELRKIIKELVFIGVVDHTFALFQHETKLFLCNTTKFSENLFYQRLIYDFQNFTELTLKPSLPIKKLLLLAFNTEESGWTAEDGDKDVLAERALEILMEKSVILREYFSLRITSDGQLESLPILLRQHRPCLTFLPIYLLRLATEVNWDTEEKCFLTFCQETASFYARISECEMEKKQKQYKWSIEHVLFAGFKQYLLPPKNLRQQMYELTNLSSLYRVFERC